MSLTQGSTSEDLYFFLGQKLCNSKISVPHEVDEEVGKRKQCELLRYNYVQSEFNKKEFSADAERSRFLQLTRKHIHPELLNLQEKGF